MSRLFVALWPPDDVVDSLAAMPRPDVEGVRWTAPDRLHVTLRFIGEADEDAAVAALSALRLPRTRVVLGSTTGMLGVSAFVMSADGLEDLAAAVVEATTHLGRPAEDEPFVGHLTLARCGDEPLEYAPDTVVEFEADEIALVRVEKSGVYDDVQRFALH